MKKRFSILCMRGVLACSLIAFGLLCACEQPDSVVPEPDPEASYTVTFDANGGTGTIPAAQTVTAGTAVTLPGESGLSRSGYTFGGWNTSADGTGTNYSAGSFYTVNADVTLYAQWNQNPPGTYTVTFNTNGGSELGSITVNEGAKLTTITTSRTGYTFDGWYTENDFINKWDFAVNTVSTDLTLYAKWIPDSGATAFAYYWVEEGEIAAAGSSTALSAGESLTISANSGGYTDQRWSVNGVEHTAMAGQSSYTFFTEESGKYIVGLIVQKDGMFYNTNFTVTVTE